MAGDAPLTISLFPRGAPSEVEGVVGPEHDTSLPDGGLVAGRPLIRLGDVSEPTITIYRPKFGANGTAVIVCPGGGYTILAYDLEGTEVCEYLNSIGVTAILLKYRVPERAGRPRWAAPLQDAQRTLGIVRSRAAEFGIDADKIGILGFSAGGHLAALLSNTDSARTYDPIDNADTASCRPDFTVLIYPAYLYAKDQPGHISPELHISQSTPPAFLAQRKTTRPRSRTASTTSWPSKPTAFRVSCTSTQKAATATACARHRPPPFRPLGRVCSRIGCGRAG